MMQFGVALSFMLWILRQNNYPFQEREAVSSVTMETISNFTFSYFFQHLKSLNPRLVYTNIKRVVRIQMRPPLPLLPPILTSGDFTKGYRSRRGIKKYWVLLFAHSSASVTMCQFTDLAS